VTWVYAFPPWLFFVAVVAGMSVLSTAGLLIARRFLKQGDELTHNDVAGPIIGTVGTVLAVILSFLLVTVWQGYDSAAQTVSQEVSAIADLFHLAPNLPPTVAGDLQATLHRYVDAVVNDEWPAMRSGGQSSTARQAASAAVTIVARFQPQTAAQQTLQQDALGLAHTFQDARRDRLFDNEQGIPTFFWVGNAILAAITIGFCFIFKVRSQAVHVLMTLALSTVIATIFVLIALFDYPFRGDSQLPPTLFVELQHRLSNDATESN
jgi:hypothetical protein